MSHLNGSEVKIRKPRSSPNRPGEQLSLDVNFSVQDALSTVDEQLVQLAALQVRMSDLRVSLLSLPDALVDSEVILGNMVSFHTSFRIVLTL